MSQINHISLKEFKKLDQSKIASIKLKDGTTIQLNNHLFSPQKLPSQKYHQFQSKFFAGNNNNYYQQPKNFFSGKQNNYKTSKEENDHHFHHKDGFGSFGQHFKTIYNEQRCIDGKGDIVKARQNYVLYVSNNLSENNIGKKKCQNYIRSSQKQPYEKNELININLKSNNENENNKNVYKMNKNEIFYNENYKNDNDIVNYEEKIEIKKKNNGNKIIVDTYEVKKTTLMRNNNKNNEKIYNKNKILQNNINKERYINEDNEKEGQQGQKYKELEYDEEEENYEEGQEENEEDGEDSEEKITKTVKIFGPSQQII